MASPVLRPRMQLSQRASSIVSEGKHGSIVSAGRPGSVAGRSPGSRVSGPTKREMLTRNHASDDSSGGSERGYRKPEQRANARRASLTGADALRLPVNGSRRPSITPPAEADAPRTNGLLSLLKRVVTPGGGHTGSSRRDDDDDDHQSYNTSDDEDRAARRVAAASPPAPAGRLTSGLTTSMRRMDALAATHAARAELYTPARARPGGALPPRHPPPRAGAAAAGRGSVSGSAAPPPRGAAGGRSGSVRSHGASTRTGTTRSSRRSGSDDTEEDESGSDEYDEEEEESGSESGTHTRTTETESRRGGGQRDQRRASRQSSHVRRQAAGTGLTRAGSSGRSSFTLHSGGSEHSPRGTAYTGSRHGDSFTNLSETSAGSHSSHTRSYVSGTRSAAASSRVKSSRVGPRRRSRATAAGGSGLSHISEEHGDEHSSVVSSTVGGGGAVLAGKRAPRKVSIMSNGLGAGDDSSIVQPREKKEEKKEKKAAEEGEEKKEEEDDSGDDEVEEFKFVRKTLPKSAFSHEELRAEFRCLDYSPLTNVRPVDTAEQLRPIKANRKLRMFICITCYNEEGDELRRTLQGVAANLPKLAKAGVHWSEVAVAIMIDGREVASQSMLDFLQYEMKLYDPSVVRNVHHGRPVVMHVFERSVELTKHATQREYHHPLQCVLGLKERNGGKLNSHLWFFSSFAVQLNPKYCVLVDVGTIPERKSLVRLYDAMEDDPQCGGVCGEILIRNARPWHFLDAAQSFEYKVSHVLDKACESVYGYISVLPGAFSAYRWVAIRGEPLCAYFTIEEISAKDLGPFLANMYLAEDRILCFEILARRHRQWLLKYVTGATAETDCPQGLIELIKQRRRWLNGSLFALLYYLYQFPRFLRTAHGRCRKFMFILQFFFFLTTTMLAWFAVATLFLSYLLVFNQGIEFAAFGANELRIFFIFGYAVLLFVQVMAGMAGKVNTMNSVYLMVCMTYGILMFFSLMLGAWLIFTNTFTPFVGLGFVCSLGSYLVAAAMHGTLARSGLMYFQYLLMIPISVNVFPIYSFANLHDISWGTKEGNLQAEQRRDHQGRADRAVKKAKKARDAIDALRKDQARAVRAVQAAAAAAQRQALMAAAGITQADANAAAAQSSGAAAAAGAGITLKGGADKMKVIDEDNEMAGYMDVATGADITLGMNVQQAANLQARIGMMDDAHLTRKLIRDAKRAAKLNEEAAAREKRLADELALDKARMQQDFNFFRMRMLSTWLLANALLVVLVAAYDRRPPFGGYAYYTTITVIYMIGFKLIGSALFQLSRCSRYLFRRACGCCYRIDESDIGVTRVVCCCRPKEYYILDDLWEQEHGYEHRYPDDDSPQDVSPEEAAMIAAANNLTLGGYAPDGTPLYFAADGTGPLDHNSNPIDVTTVGFLQGHNGELYMPDGSPAEIGVVWVDENGNPVDVLRDLNGMPIRDADGNPIPRTAAEVAQDSSGSEGTVHTVYSGLQGVAAGQLPEKRDSDSDDEDVEDVDASARRAEEFERANAAMAAAAFAVRNDSDLSSFAPHTQREQDDDLDLDAQYVTERGDVTDHEGGTVGSDAGSDTPSDDDMMGGIEDHRAVAVVVHEPEAVATAASEGQLSPSAREALISSAAIQAVKSSGSAPRLRAAPLSGDARESSSVAELDGRRVSTSATAAGVTRPAVPSLRLVARNAALRTDGAARTDATAASAAARASEVTSGSTSARGASTTTTWGRLFTAIPDMLGLRDAHASSDDDDADDAAAPGRLSARMRSTPLALDVSARTATGPPAVDVDGRTSTSPHAHSVPKLSARAPSLAQNEFPVVRVNTSTLRSARSSAELPQPPPPGSVAVTVAASPGGHAAPRVGGRPGPNVGASMLGYTDDATGRWIPPTAAERTTPDSDLDDDDDDVRVDTVAPLVSHRSGVSGAEGGAPGARAARAALQRTQSGQRASLMLQNRNMAASSAPVDMIDLDDLLKDAEAQSDKVMRRATIAAPPPAAAGRGVGRGGRAAAPSLARSRFAGAAAAVAATTRTLRASGSSANRGTPTAPISTTAVLPSPSSAAPAGLSSPPAAGVSPPTGSGSSAHTSAGGSVDADPTNVPFTTPSDSSSTPPSSK